ncbi:MAG: hypothetical protein MHPSP_004264, partial [Paramarteilia canceri]
MVSTVVEFKDPAKSASKAKKKIKRPTIKKNHFCDTVAPQFKHRELKRKAFEF